MQQLYTIARRAAFVALLALAFVSPVSSRTVVPICTHTTGVCAPSAPPSA